MSGNFSKYFSGNLIGFLLLRYQVVIMQTSFIHFSPKIQVVKAKVITIKC